MSEHNIMVTQLFRDFEAGILPLVVGIFPSYFAPKAYEGRRALQAALGKYYRAKHDLEPDVARMTKVRAGHYRKFGISDDDIGNFEIALLHVSTANAIPTLFWHLVFVASSLELTATLREELLSVITILPSK